MEDSESEQDLQDAIALKVFDGEESALADMLVHYGPRIERGLLKKYPGLLSLEDIEEIISDALRRFWSARDRYDDRKGSIRWLLYIIACRRARDVLRLGWRRAKLVEVDVEKEFLESQYVDDRHVGASISVDPPASEQANQRQQSVRDVLAELPDIQRQILEHDALAEEEVDSTELGRRLGGIPGGTIRVYRSRARDAFRKGMKKRGHDVGPVETQDVERTS